MRAISRTLTLALVCDGSASSISPDGHQPIFSRRRLAIVDRLQWRNLKSSSTFDASSSYGYRFKTRAATPKRLLAALDKLG